MEEEKRKRNLSWDNERQLRPKFSAFHFRICPPECCQSGKNRRRVDQSLQGRKSSTQIGVYIEFSNFSFRNCDQSLQTSTNKLCAREHKIVISRQAFPLSLGRGKTCGIISLALT